MSGAVIRCHFYAPPFISIAVLTPFLGVVPPGFRRYLIPHSSQDVGGCFGSEDQGANERRWNLSQDPTNCSSDALLIVAFRGAVDDVGSLFLDSGVEDLGKEGRGERRLGGEVGKWQPYKVNIKSKPDLSFSFSNYK